MTDDLSTRDGNVTANLKKWDRQHRWPEDGDEWKGQSVVCGVPYAQWKQSLVDHLIVPYVGTGMHAIEIAPGYGRWTEFLSARAAKLTLVDLSPTCLAHCRARFPDRNLDLFQSKGSDLPDHDGAIDVVWSFDAFVHMHPDVVREYIAEIARVLKPGGRAVIHHAGIEDLAAHKQKDHEGWRSAVNADLVRGFAVQAGLSVEAQFTTWADGLGVPRFGDKVSVLRKG